MPKESTLQERLLKIVTHYATLAVEKPHNEREAFVDSVIERMRQDMVAAGLETPGADEYRQRMREWITALVSIIESSGGASPGNA